MTTDKPKHDARRAIRSFVIRGGRMTESQQLALDREFNRFGLQVDDGIADWHAIFGNAHPVTLEIGFGMGDSLASMAAASPDENFVGIEVHRPGVGRLLSLAAKQGLDNLRVYNADAIEVLKHCIAVTSLARVNIYFPDPWHKKRHHKRRLIQQPLLDLLQPRMQQNALLHIATDWQPYAEQVLELFASQPAFSNVAGERQFVERAAYGRPETKFERRGLRLGHGVWDIVYRYNDSAQPAAGQ